MGQRHQAWLIARIVPHGSADGKAYYYSLGGWHEQWCHGLHAVNAIDRFITLIKNPVNAALVREELKAFELEELDNGKTAPDIDLPCPYTHFLLATAFDIDLDNKSIRKGSFAGASLSSTMGCWDTANDDGITIVDVTDPHNPSYSFCGYLGGIENIGTARGYVHWKLPETFDESEPDDGSKEKRLKAQYRKQSRALVAKFNKIPVLGINALAEAWPRDYRKFRVKEAVPDDAESEASIAEAFATTSKPSRSSAVPSLTDLVLELAIARALESGVTDAIDFIIQEKHREIKAILQVQNPFPENGLPLLVSTLRKGFGQKNMTTLNLSGFSLSPEQLASVVSDLQLCPARSPPKIVILNDSPQVTAKHIHSLLTICPTFDIDRLEICNTNITNDALTSLINTHPTLFHRTSDIIHPLFISGGGPSTKGCFHVSAMRYYWGSVRYDQSYLRHPAVPVWTPKKIVRCLLDWLDVVGVKNTSEKVLESVAVEAAMGAGLRCGESYEEEDARFPRSLVPTPAASAVPPWKERIVTSYLQTTEIGDKGNEQVRDGDWVFLFEQPGRNKIFASAMRRFGMALDEPYHGNRYAFVKVFKDNLREAEVTEEGREEGEGERGVKKKATVHSDDEDKTSSNKVEAADSDHDDDKAPSIAHPLFTVKIYDLHHFLQEMKNEGRGPLPDQSLIDQWNTRLVENDAGVEEEEEIEDVVFFRNYFNQNSERSGEEMEPVAVTLFDEESAVDFMQKAQWSPEACTRY